MTKKQKCQKRCGSGEGLLHLTLGKQIHAIYALDKVIAMVSSLSQQLSKLTSDTTNSLNLKAQKAAHAKSLIWEAKDAAFQDFDTIYAVCYEGFQELCLLDPRFAAFGRTIFSEHSKTQDRDQMTAEENNDLDRVLNDFLELVGARLLLTPALKAVEWTVRRFR